MAKHVSPAISETAFSCPHCGAFATQFWHAVSIGRLRENGIPNVWTVEEAEAYDFTTLEKDQRESFRKLLNRISMGKPFKEKGSNYNDPSLLNVSISECYNCREFGIWVYDKLVWPSANFAPEANPDMPELVRQTYDEAGAILNLSPRGSSALLRLAVQLLSIELGEKGKNLDDDIKSLVAKGLDPRVQVALDVVRVVGNNAVHPGQLDLKDDRPTAEKLFGLVNLICEIMISQPRHLSSMFEGLPEGAKKSNSAA